VRLAAAEIGAIERGERLVRAGTATRIAAALGVEVHDLVHPASPEPVLPFVRVEYTYHANLRRAERSIPPDLAYDVLADPDVTYGDRGALVAERTMPDGKPWRVVYVEVAEADGLVARVITLHRIDRVRKAAPGT